MTTTRHLRRVAAATCFAILAALSLGACASSRPTETTLVIEPADYDRAFIAARDALRDERFRLQRVDAAGGVITTRQLDTAGFATPWHTEQTSIRAEWTDFVADRQRVAVVTFEPVADRSALDAPPAASRSADTPHPRTQAAPPTTPPTDLRQLEQDTAANAPNTPEAILMRVRIVVERMQQPGIQVSPYAVRRVSRYTDADWVRRGIQAPHAIPVTDDPRLAARVVDRVRKQLAEPTPSRIDETANDG